MWYKAWLGVVKALVSERNRADDTETDGFALAPRVSQAWPQGERRDTIILLHPPILSIHHHRPYSCSSRQLGKLTRTRSPRVRVRAILIAHGKRARSVYARQREGDTKETQKTSLHQCYFRTGWNSAGTFIVFFIVLFIYLFIRVLWSKRCNALYPYLLFLNHIINRLLGLELMGSFVIWEVGLL